MNKLLKIILILLVVVCIFDPADKILGLKVPFFVLAGLLFIFDILANHKTVYIPLSLILYLMLFILIPLISISYYFFTVSDFENYDVYQYFKSYLFITITLVLYVSKIDLIKPMVVIMSVLSVFSISILIISCFNFPLVEYLYAEVGQRYGIYSMGTRDYGNFLLPNLPQVYFHTSQLIIFPVTYFTMKLFFSEGATRMLCGSFLAINMIAMFFGATRNNIMTAILAPLLVSYWYSKKGKIIVSGLVVFLIMLCIFNIDAIKESMFSGDNTSNIYKISFLNDYLNLFADKKILLFGQGLGSYFFTTMRGYVSLTELTFFEYIRRFGLILSLISFCLFLYPLSKLRLKKYYSVHYVFIAYLFYLIISFSNPFLMSSSGMLMLSLVLHKAFSTPSPSNLSRSHVTT